MRDLAGEAATLRALHIPGVPLVLPNAWDSASARVVEAAGFPVIATSSAAVAAALGFADGHDTPPGEMFDAIARIAASVSVPVTADIERGYGVPPAELVERLLAAGAVGANLEDSTGNRRVDSSAQADFLHACREAAQRCGVPVVINARVDTFLARPGSAAPGLAGPGSVAAGLADTEDAVQRARLYLEAGADCVYPILAPPSALSEIVAAVNAPVNGWCAIGQPRAELVASGVARISYGAGLFNSVAATLRELIRGLGD